MKSSMGHLSKVLVQIGVALILSGTLRAESAPQNQTAIAIGALMPLTGEFAMPAAAFRQGIELAVDEINEHGGINGKKLSVIIEDTQSNPKLINAAASKLLSVNHVVAGLTTSYPETEIGGGIFQRAHVPSLALWDSSPQIDAMGDYIFAIGPWTPSDAEVTASFCAQTLKARRAAVISSVEPWSELVGDLFEKEFAHHGGTIVARFKQNPGDSDFRSILTKVRSLNPDVIYAPLASDIIAFHKQKLAGKILTPIISSGVITDTHVTEAPEALEGVYQSQINDPQRPQTVELGKRYREKFGKEMTMAWYVATGYDGVELYAHALRAVGADPLKLKEFLYTIKGFPGAAQDISISAGGSSPYLVRMFRIEHSKFKLQS